MSTSPEGECPPRRPPMASLRLRLFHAHKQQGLQNGVSSHCFVGVVLWQYFNIASSLLAIQTDPEQWAPDDSTTDGSAEPTVQTITWQPMSHKRVWLTQFLDLTCAPLRKSATCILRSSKAWSSFMKGIWAPLWFCMNPLVRTARKISTPDISLLMVLQMTQCTPVRNEDQEYMPFKFGW